MFLLFRPCSCFDFFCLFVLSAIVARFALVFLFFFLYILYWRLLTCCDLVFLVYFFNGACCCAYIRMRVNTNAQTAVLST